MNTHQISKHFGLRKTCAPWKRENFEFNQGITSVLSSCDEPFSTRSFPRLPIEFRTIMFVFGRRFLIRVRFLFFGGGLAFSLDLALWGCLATFFGCRFRSARGASLSFSEVAGSHTPLIKTKNQRPMVFPPYFETNVVSNYNNFDWHDCCMAAWLLVHEFRGVRFLRGGSINGHEKQMASWDTFEAKHPHKFPPYRTATSTTSSNSILFRSLMIRFCSDLMLSEALEIFK